jgi:hypothetical protein
VRSPPTTQPMAPAPMIPILMPVGSFAWDSGNTS